MSAAVMKLKPAQEKALNWLHNAGGDASIQPGGVLLCGGQRGRFMPETWLAIVSHGLIESAGPMRLRLSAAGRKFCIDRFGRADVMKTSWADNACEDDL